MAPRSLLFALVLASACSGQAVVTAPPTPTTSGASDTTVADTAADATSPTPTPSSGMQWARAARYALQVPAAAQPLGSARWRIPSTGSESVFNIGVSAAPFSGTADDFVRSELGNTSLTALVAAALVDQPGAPGWRAWSVLAPGAESVVISRVRFLADGARTVFALCAHEERRPAQAELCQQVLSTLRVGRRAERSTAEPTLTTISENDAAVDVPSTWRRQSGEAINITPSAQSPDSERDMVVYLGFNTNTTNLNDVIDGSIAGARTQARTVVDVRERRVRQGAAGAEGALTMRSTTQSLGHHVLGRAHVEGGWAWAVICLAPEGASTDLCAQSVASFEAVPR